MIAQLEIIPLDSSAPWAAPGSRYGHLLENHANRKRGGGQLSERLELGDFCQVGIDPGLQLSVGKLLDDFGAKEFSMPLT